MEPLVGFVAEMSKRYPTPTRADFATIDSILGAQGNSPHEVQEALDRLKPKASAERYILASFKSLPQGKKLMSLAEEFVEGKTHLVKIIATFDDIAKRCESHTLAMSGMPMDAAIKAFTSECGSYKAASPNASPDDAATKKALSLANASLKGLAEALLKHHITQEASQYLQVQAKTIAASRILSKPPGFAILTVNDLLEKAINERVVGLDDIRQFYVDLGSVAESTDALIRLPEAVDAASSKNLQKVSVQLCQRFTAWKSSLVKVNCSCRDMQSDVEALQNSLDALVSETSVRVWEAAMNLPIMALTGVIRQEKPTDEGLRNALNGIPDAKLLATGPQREEVREDLTIVTWCVEQLLNVVACTIADSEGQNHAKAIRFIFEIFVAMDVLPEKTVLNQFTGTHVNLEKIAHLGYCLFVWGSDWRLSLTHTNDNTVQLCFIWMCV